MILNKMFNKPRTFFAKSAGYDHCNPHSVFGSLVKCLALNKVRGKYLLIGLLCFMFLALPLSAGAIIPEAARGAVNSVVDCTLHPVDCLIGGTFKVLTQVFIGVTGFFISILASMIAWVLKLPIYGNPVVNMGWTYSKNIVNMFFLLGLLAIGISTILRLETFGAKKTFARLIIAALLINFSLQIAGVFVDFSDVFNRYFLNTISGDWGGILTKAFGWQQFYAVFNTTGAPPEVMDSFIRMLFVLLLGILMIVAFIMVFVLFIIRYIAIVILLIVAPFAWFFWIFPELSVATGQNIWSKWWSSYFKYIFFAPIMLFFLTIAMVSATALGDFNSPANNASILSNTDINKTLSYNNPGGDPKNSLLVLGVNMIIVLGLVFGGMKVAMDMSVAGAGAAMAYAKKAGGWARGKTQAMAMRGAVRAGSRVAETEAAKRAGASWVSGLEKISRVPVVGKALSAPLRWGTEGMIKYGEAVKAQTLKGGEAYAHMSPANLDHLLRIVGNRPDKRAQIVAAKNMQQKLTPEEARKYTQDIERFGLHKSIKDTLPTYNKDSWKLEDNLKEAKKTGDNKRILEAQLELDKKTLELLKNIKGQDLNKVAFGVYAKGEDEASKSVQRQMVSLSPQVVASAFSGLRGTEIDSLNETMRNVLGASPAEREQKLQSSNPPLYNWHSSFQAKGLGFSLFPLTEAVKKGVKAGMEDETSKIKVVGPYADIDKEKKT